MARVNITVPDDVLDRARAAGLNISQVTTAALVDELDRRAKVTELDRYLRELEAELGPIPADDERAAREWADAAFGPSDHAERQQAPRSA